MMKNLLLTFKLLLFCVVSALLAVGQASQQNFAPNNYTITPGQINGTKLLDGNNRTLQQIYAQPGFAGGDLDFSFTQPSVNVIAPADLFMNTAPLPAPTLVLTQSCSGIANFLTTGNFLTAFVAQYDPYGQVIFSASATSGAVPAGGNWCYTVTPPLLNFAGVFPDITNYAYWSVFALQCASTPCTLASLPAPPVQGTLQYSSFGGGSWNWLASSNSVRTFGYTTAASSISITPCVYGTSTCPTGLVPGNANPGLEVANVTINLDTNGGYLTILPTAIPTGAKIVGKNRQNTTLMQLSQSAPNGVPSMVVANGKLISTGTIGATKAITVQLGLLDSGSGSAQLVYLSPPVSYGPTDALLCPNNGNCTLQVNNPAPPIMFQPWVANTVYQVGQRITDSNSGSTPPAIWQVVTSGKTDNGTGGLWLPPSCTTGVTEGTVVLNCLLQPLAYQTTHAYAAGDEIYVSSMGAYFMVTTAGTTDSSTPAFSTNAKNLGQTITDNGVVFQNLGGPSNAGGAAFLNTVIKPQFQWYVSVCNYPTTGACAYSTLLASGSAHGLDGTLFSGCSGQSAAGQFWNKCDGTNNMKANFSTFVATGGGSAPPTATVASTACPTGFANCPNTVSASACPSPCSYFTTWGATTDGGLTNAQGESTVSITTGNAILMTQPSNLPPNATGWIPGLSYTSYLETPQLCDGIHCVCGSGAANQYTAYQHSIACSRAAANATIVDPIINTSGPFFPLANDTDAVFYLGGNSPLQQYQCEISPICDNGGGTSVGGYASRLENFQFECGRSRNNLEPSGLLIYAGNAQEGSGTNQILGVDCPSGAHSNGPGAQNGGLAGLHFQGQTQDSGFGVLVQDVPSYRFLSDFSASGFAINSQFYTQFGVGIFTTPNAGSNAFADVRDISGELDLDVVLFRNSSGVFTKVTPSGASGRKSNSCIHLDGWSHDVSGMGVACNVCGILNDAKGVNCRTVATLPVDFYSFGNAAGNGGPQAPEQISSFGTAQVGKPFHIAGASTNLSNLIYNVTSSATGAGGAGLYRVSVDAFTVTTGTGGTCAVPAINIVYNNGTAETLTPATQLPAAWSCSGAVGSEFSWNGVIHVASNTSITITTTGINNTGGFTYTIQGSVSEVAPAQQ